MLLAFALPAQLRRSLLLPLHLHSKPIIKAWLGTSPALRWDHSDPACDLHLLSLALSQSSHMRLPLSRMNLVKMPLTKVMHE